eukprot:1577305-Pleurochrysis_carterae.AAC.1
MALPKTSRAAPRPTGDDTHVSLRKQPAKRRTAASASGRRRAVDPTDHPSTDFVHHPSRQACLRGAGADPLRPALRGLQSRR